MRSCISSLKRDLYRGGLILVLLGVSGCSPTLQLGGAYFPAWLISMLAGFFCVVVVRLVFLKIGIDEAISPRALAYPAMGLVFTLLIYLLFFS